MENKAVSCPEKGQYGKNLRISWQTGTLQIPLQEFGRPLSINQISFMTKKGDGTIGRGQYERSSLC
jgi:hypothetical protein